MNLLKTEVLCPICGDPMEPYWREVSDTQKYVCKGKCWAEDRSVRLYITLDDAVIKKARKKEELLKKKKEAERGTARSTMP